VFEFFLARRVLSAWTTLLDDVEGRRVRERETALGRGGGLSAPSSFRAAKSERPFVKVVALALWAWVATVERVIDRSFIGKWAAPRITRRYVISFEVLSFFLAVTILVMTDLFFKPGFRIATIIVIFVRCVTFVLAIVTAMRRAITGQRWYLWFLVFNLLLFSVIWLPLYNVACYCPWKIAPAADPDGNLFRQCELIRYSSYFYKRYASVTQAKSEHSGSYDWFNPFPDPRVVQRALDQPNKVFAYGGGFLTNPHLDGGVLTDAHGGVLYGEPEDKYSYVPTAEDLPAEKSESEVSEWDDAASKSNNALPVLRDDHDDDGDDDGDDDPGVIGEDDDDSIGAADAPAAQSFQKPAPSFKPKLSRKGSVKNLGASGSKHSMAELNPDFLDEGDRYLTASGFKGLFHQRLQYDVLPEGWALGEFERLNSVRTVSPGFWTH
jgi:hypothetical protein